jgi:PAS domain S-box-containing protein
MSEQPFLAAALLFVVVMTLGLLRLGRGVGGWHWAAAWVCLWAAGGFVALAESYPVLVPLLPAFGTAFATLLLTGTMRFLGRPVPPWVWATGAAVGVLRVTLVPFLSREATEAAGGLVISVGALAATGLLWRARRADGSRRHRLLAVSFPTAAVAATFYAWGSITGVPSWTVVFVWLMAGILLSGTQVVSLVQRIAERAESERAVLASLIESVPVGLALFDPGRELRAANRAFAKITGHADPARIERESDLVDALAELVDPTEADTLRTLESGSGPGDGGHELRFRSGAQVVVAMAGVSGSDGEPMGHLWLLRDVTEERRLQETLERARRLETLGGFAGGVAHDFNNQLTAVLGNAGLARESLPTDHPAHEILTDLVKSAEYCARLTQDVLDFARRGRGRPTEVDLAELLPRILERCDGGRAGHAIAPEAAWTRADPVQVERVVANLVENGRHAAGPEGRVEVIVRRGGPADRVVLEVRDDGPGIEDATRARIFDPFFTTRPVGEGSGLGLAIVYGIVTGQGGEVRVECPPGGGTRMITTWPAAEPPAA